MGLTIEFDENSIRASREPFYIKAIAEIEEYVVAGKAERWRVVFSEIPAIDDSMSFTIDTRIFNVEFTNPAIPGGQPSSFPETILCPSASSGTIAEFLDNNLIPILQSAQAFDDYTIFRSGTNGLNFLAIQHAQNRISGFSATGFSATESHLTDGEFDVLDPEYYVKAQVMMTKTQNSGVFDLASPWLYFKPQIKGSDAYVDFEISEVLDGMMENVDLVNIFSSSATVLESCRDYYIRICEHYGDNATDIPCHITDKFKLLKGGRRSGDYSAIEAEYVGKFLTLRQNPYVDRRMNDWLYFFEQNQTAGETFKMRATVKGVWGTSTGANYTTITLDGGTSIHKVPCGYNQLGLQALLGDEEPMYYDIEIYKFEGGVIGDLVIDAFRFYVLPESDTRMGLHYFNFLGLMEAQSLDAETVYANAWNKEAVMISKPREGTVYGSGKEVHKERSIQSSQQMELTVNTGPLSPANWVAAQDIMLSERVWFVNLNEVQERVAAQVVKGSEKMVPYSQNGVNHHSLAFKIQFNQEKGNSVPAAITT